MRCLAIILAGGIMMHDLTSESCGKSRESAGSPLLVALLQMRPEGHDEAVHLQKAERFCRLAARKGADIALMPEMWQIGYWRFDPDKEGDRDRFWGLAIREDSPWVQHFARLARELDMAIGVTYEQEYAPLPRNAITLFDRHGQKVFTYAKVHTSDFKPMEASMTPGDEFFVGTLDTRQGPLKVGAMICFDREQPESARILMLKGAELILTPNCCDLDDRRICQFRVRAFENLVGVAMSNYARPYKNGRSVAFDSEGNLLVEAGAKEGVFMAQFDRDLIREQRLKGIWGNAYRRPHRYGMLTSQEKEDVWRRIDGLGEPYDALER